MGSGWGGGGGGREKADPNNELCMVSPLAQLKCRKLPIEGLQALCFPTFKINKELAIHVYKDSGTYFVAHSEAKRIKSNTDVLIT